MKTRSVTFYVVLRRGRWSTEATIVRKSIRKPRLVRGECAVKVSLSVPDEAFEPVFVGPSLAFEVGEVLRAPVQGAKA